MKRAPLHLLPAATTIHGAMACKDGAIKYGPYNWRDKPIEMMSYIGAIERHIARLKDGENIDNKSGATHLGHIIATAGIIIDAASVDMLIDDRPEVDGKATVILDAIEGVEPEDEPDGLAAAKNYEAQVKAMCEVQAEKFGTEAWNKKLDRVSELRHEMYRKGLRDSLPEVDWPDSDLGCVAETPKPSVFKPPMKCGSSVPSRLSNPPESNADSGPNPCGELPLHQTTIFPPKEK